MLASLSARTITIMDDNSFTRGSLVIKAHKSVVDAHVKTQILKVKDILLSRIASKKNGSVNQIQCEAT